MKKDYKIRGIDEYTWQQFQLKCKKEFGKEWGHLPYPSSPITSGPAYIITRLIELYLEGKVCVFVNDKDSKTDIILKTVQALDEHQKDVGPFLKAHVHESLMYNSISLGLKPSQRTLKDYGALIIQGYCTKLVNGAYALDLSRIKQINEHTHEFDPMFR